MQIGLGARRLAFATLLVLASAHGVAADEFRLTVGSPIAGNAPHVKASLFVVRVDGCPEPARARIAGTAEGIVNDVRQTVPLALIGLSTPGVYAVNRGNWPAGTWIIHLVASYETLRAGALVPIGPQGFRREMTKFFPRAAAAVEVDAALQLLAANGGAR